VTVYIGKENLLGVLVAILLLSFHILHLFSELDGADQLPEDNIDINYLAELQELIRRVSAWRLKKSHCLLQNVVQR